MEKITDIMNGAMNSIGKEPEFTAFELNKLKSLARKGGYYQNADDFVHRFMRDALTWDVMTEKQRKWLWGIKRDMEKILGDEG